MKSFRLHLNYRQRIFCSIFIFTLIPLIIFGGIFLMYTSENKVKSVTDNYQSALTAMMDKVDIRLSQSIYKTDYIINNSLLNTILTKQYQANDYLTMFNTAETVSQIFDALSDNNQSSTLMIYSLNPTQLSNQYIMKISQLDQKIADEILANKQEIFTWMIKTQPDPSNSEKTIHTICLYRKIMYLGTPIGIIEIKHPLDILIPKPANNFPKHYVLELHSKTNNETALIDYSESDQVDQILKKNHLQLFANSKISNYRLAMTIPKFDIMSQLINFWGSALILLLLIIFIIAYSVQTTSKTLTRQLEHLILNMNKNFEVLLHEKPPVFDKQDEFNIIYTRFFESIQIIKDYYDKIIQYETRTKTLEMDLLQERINPHFLYNTLSVIKWVSTNDQVSKLVDAMVRYYRIALSRGQHVIRISDELDLIEQYLTIQKFNLASKFEFTIEVNPEILDFYILKQLLQPLVENAVLHGINELEHPGFIQISGYRQDENIIFKISDNGTGMDQETIDVLLSDYGSGYGFKNVRKRIQLTYGTPYDISIQSELDKGTVITLTIPQVTEIS